MLSAVMEAEITDEVQWTKDSFYEEFKDVFTNIARRSNWSGSGEDDLDLEQWLWMHFYEIWDKAQFWSRAIVITHANRRTKEHARQERIDYENFRTSFVYTPRLIDMYLRETVWCDAEDAPDVLARADVSTAFAQLNKNRRHVVFCYYALGEVYERDSAKDKTRKRAIKQMAETLNMQVPTSEWNAE